MTSTLLHLDSAVATVRDSSRLALLALAHLRLSRSELNQGARVLLAQLENRGQLTQGGVWSSPFNSGVSSPSIPGDSGFSSVSSPPLLPSPGDYHASPLSMLSYLSTVKRFWSRELASATFLPETLQSTAQLTQLVEHLLPIFGEEIRPELSQLGR